MGVRSTSELFDEEIVTDHRTGSALTSRTCFEHKLGCESWIWARFITNPPVRFSPTTWTLPTVDPYLITPAIVNPCKAVLENPDGKFPGVYVSKTLTVAKIIMQNCVEFTRDCVISRFTRSNGRANFVDMLGRFDKFRQSQRLRPRCR